MLATRLIRLIESNAEPLTHGLIHQLKTNPKTAAYRRFSDLELHHFIYDVYKNLGVWIAGKSEEQIRQQYQALGEHRFQGAVPLPEVLFAQILTKNHLLDYVQTHGFGGTALEIYSEQELRNKVDQFFDSAIYYTALGYYHAQQAAKAHSAGTK